MKLLVVIVNYRTAALTVDCLGSLADEGTPRDRFRVVVVDNASGDDSATQIRAAIADRGWSDFAELIEAPRNGGFAYGNNAAIRPALAAADRPEFVLLLNSDTVVRPGAVQTLVRFLEARPDVGIVGSRLEDPDGTPQCSAFRFPSLRSEFAEAVNVGVVNRLFKRHIILPGISDAACPMPWVAGASMLVRREVFDSIGLLDENYFLYYEEVDFCLRAARAGFACWYEPASRVVHLVGRSSGVTERNPQPKRRPAYWFDSRRRYFVKNHGRTYAAAVDLVWSAGFAAHRLLSIVRRRPQVDPPRLLRDYLKHSVFARGFSLSPSSPGGC
jgi:GT2 family glycosyltransferase